MPSFNEVIMAGHVTRDPQLSYTPGKLPVCKFGLAVSHKRKDKEKVCFIDCTIFGKSAEIFNQYVKKGKAVLIRGRLDFDQWTSKEGQKRSKHSIVVEDFQFLGGKGGDSGRAPATPGEGIGEETPDDGSGIPF